MKIDLGQYDNRGYVPGAGLVRRIVWYLTNATVFCSWVIPLSGLKGWLLRIFGARIGSGVVIKPRVNIKYPWHLTVGDDVWIGEGVWIDDLAAVTLGNNVCISQDAYLLTGNHDYKDPRFGLLTGEITISDGAWVGARAVVCPGVRMGEHSILTAGSVLGRDAQPWGIYRGNPAELVRKRVLSRVD
jgi:putative colanic acid biosynthesis acetyltransferase WcaF